MDVMCASGQGAAARTPPAFRQRQDVASGLPSITSMGKDRRESLLGVAQTLCNLYDSSFVSTATAEALQLLFPQACFLSLQLMVGNGVLVSVDNLLEAGDASITFLQRQSSLAGLACLTGSPLSSRVADARGENPMQDLQHICKRMQATRVTCVPLFWHYRLDDQQWDLLDSAARASRQQAQQAGTSADAAALDACPVTASSLADIVDQYRRDASFPCLGCITLGVPAAGEPGGPAGSGAEGGEGMAGGPDVLSQLTSLVQLALAAAAPVVDNAQSFLEQVAILIGVRGLDYEYEYVPGEGFVQLTEEDFTVDEDDIVDSCLSEPPDDEQLDPGYNSGGGSCSSGRWQGEDPDDDGGAQAMRCTDSVEEHLLTELDQDTRSEGSYTLLEQQPDPPACASSMACQHLQQQQQVVGSSSGGSGSGSGAADPTPSWALGDDGHAEAPPQQAQQAATPGLPRSNATRSGMSDKSRDTPAVEAPRPAAAPQPAAVLQQLRPHPWLLFFQAPGAEAGYCCCMALLALTCDRASLLLHLVLAACHQWLVEPVAGGGWTVALLMWYQVAVLAVLLATTYLLPQHWMRYRELLFVIGMLSKLPSYLTWSSIQMGTFAPLAENAAAGLSIVCVLVLAQVRMITMLGVLVPVLLSLVLGVWLQASGPGAALTQLAARSDLHLLLLALGVAYLRERRSRALIGPRIEQAQVELL